MVAGIPLFNVLISSGAQLWFVIALSKHLNFTTGLENH
jgi:hypothetical protein